MRKKDNEVTRADFPEITDWSWWDEIVNDTRKKIDEQLKKLEAEIMRSEKILNNQGFLAKAPESKINEEKAKQESYKQAYEALIVKKKELTQ